MQRARGVSALLGLIVVVGGLIAPAAVVAEDEPGQKGAEVSEAVKHDVSPPLRMAHVPSPDAARETEKPLRRINVGRGNGPDGALQTTTGPDVAVTTPNSFEGVGAGQYGFSVQYAPPDTNGAVGATQYVQWVNTYMAVFNKSTHALQMIQPGNAVWAGFGGGCQTNNDGDPIVQYDKIANRWILTQFSVSTKPVPAVRRGVDDVRRDGSVTTATPSATATPTSPTTRSWASGRTATTSATTSSAAPSSGAKVCAFDRTAMLAGAAATPAVLPASSPYGGLLPSDLDGSTLPPAGAPNVFAGFGSNSLQTLEVPRRLGERRQYHAVRPASIVGRPPSARRATAAAPVSRSRAPTRSSTRSATG